jgi:hypothetical protein
MSEKIDQLVPFLVTLSKLKPHQRKILLSFLTKDQVKAFEEVAVNIVKNTTTLSPQQLRVCQRWRKPLKLLALKKYPFKAKKEILQQKGGFFPALLPLLASVIGAVIAR